MSEIGKAACGGPRGVSRLLSKLKTSMDKGEYYEAHQMYRTLYFRYTTQKAYNECLELLFSGAAKLLTKQEQSSAADLCLLLVDTLEKRDYTNNSDNNEWIQRLGTLIGGFGANIIERDTLIQRAVKWSGNAFGNSFGHPSLHKMIAQVYWKERNIEQARHHFLLSQDGNMCGRILAQISESKGFLSEVDLFIVQAVLQILCLKDRKTAEDTFKSYTQHHPQILRKNKPFKEPLLNFLFFLFRLIDMKTLPAFCVLRKLYEPSLNRDPSFMKYLSKIGTIYFGEAPAPQSSGSGMLGGMFGDIFSRLLQGFDDEDDADDVSATIPRPDANVNAELD